MNCKHCSKPVEHNTVSRSMQPWVYHPWKHKITHLVGCYNDAVEPLGTKAEPEEEK